MACRPMYSKLKDFQSPFGTVTLQDGTTLVAETKYHRIRVYGADGRELDLFGSKGTCPGKYESPRGICETAWEQVAVADTANARVQVISAISGKALRTVSGGVLHTPWDVACSPEGILYVVDMGRSCLQIFNDKGESINCVDRLKNGEKIFDKPCRVEYHSHTKKIHVADRRNTRIHQLEATVECRYLSTRGLELQAECW